MLVGLAVVCALLFELAVVLLEFTGCDGVCTVNVPLPRISIDFEIPSLRFVPPLLVLLLAVYAVIEPDSVLLVCDTIVTFIGKYAFGFMVPLVIDVVIETLVIFGFVT